MMRQIPKKLLEDIAEDYLSKQAWKSHDIRNLIEGSGIEMMEMLLKHMEVEVIE